VLRVGPKTGGLGMASGATYLREISVGPQPLQKPYPQFWMPITSPRSLDFCARTGMNAIQTSTPTPTVRKEMEIFYNAAKNYGFPDRLDRGEFAYGWDSAKKRGVATVRIVHLIDKGIGNREASDLGNDLYFHFIAPFGLGGDPRDPEKAMAVPKPQDLIDAGISLVGSPQLVIDGIMDLKESGGYDDMLLLLIFDMHGQPSEAVEAQMQHFSETVMPVLHKEMGHNDDMSPVLAPPARPEAER
jgi:alkanesulfonate monooxygenase SsuD/methylene tetrahydromethanopterin reductase-like flavin-dependent oxidoreductase (luciferase family)